MTADLQGTIRQVYSLEQLSCGHTCVHHLHPLVKLLTTLSFLVVVVSFPRYDFAGLIPYLFYTVILTALAEIPQPLLLRRAALALPFCLLAGLSNILFDTSPLFALGALRVSYGMASFFTILFRTYLCVTSVLILVAATPFTDLTDQMRRLKAPEIFVTIFEMTYRYIGALLEEALSMYTAYMLRGARRRGIEMRHMGSFVGQLLLRSFERAERVYGAMKCRGFALRRPLRRNRPLARADWAFLIGVNALLVLFRLLNVPGLYNQLVGRLL